MKGKCLVIEESGGTSCYQVPTNLSLILFSLFISFFQLYLKCCQDFDLQPICQVS